MKWPSFSINKSNVYAGRKASHKVLASGYSGTTIQLIYYDIRGVNNDRKMVGILRTQMVVPSMLFYSLSCSTTRVECFVTCSWTHRTIYMYVYTGQIILTICVGWIFCRLSVDILSTALFISGLQMCLAPNWRDWVTRLKNWLKWALNERSEVLRVGGAYFYTLFDIIIMFKFFKKRFGGYSFDSYSANDE